jgi:hypothetical protein
MKQFDGLNDDICKTRILEAYIFMHTVRAHAKVFFFS